MGERYGSTKGGSKGKAGNFARTNSSWVCGPCNSRNPAKAGFCAFCGKAKKWVQDKSIDTPQDPQATALRKATAEFRKEFDKDFKLLRNWAKGGGGKGGGGGRERAN